MAHWKKLEPLPGDKADSWPITLQFVRETKRKYVDAAARIYDFYDGGLIDRIEGNTGPAILCMAFWGGLGPRHLVDPDFLVEEEGGPWREIKRFATLEDFYPAVRNKKLSGRILCDAGNGHWHAMCDIYHDYLSYRTYLAAEIYLSVYPNQQVKGAKPLDDEEWIDLFVESVKKPEFSAPAYSKATTLVERHKPYDELRFVESIRKLFDLHSSWRNLDFEWPWGGNH